MIDYKTVADAANMIINGYAFTKDSENIANKIQRKYISMDMAGTKNPEISILSEEYMEKIRRMMHKNIAAEMLRKLLEDNIRVFAKTGVVKSQLFSEKMQNLLKMYNNRLITSAEVIEELLNLSKEMTEAYRAGDEKGLSTEELAFYDALAADPEVLKKDAGRDLGGNGTGIDGIDSQEQDV